MPKTHPTRRSRHAKAPEGPPDDRTMCQHCRADRHAEELLASALAPVETEIKDTSLTVTAIRFKHSKGKPLTLTIKGTTTPQDCPLQIMEAYLSVRGAAAGTLFVYSPSVSVTRAKFNEQLRGSLQFCHFCPKQFKSHSFPIGPATTAAAQGMSESQIRSLGRRSSDVFMKYIRCSQRVSALSRALA